MADGTNLIIGISANASQAVAEIGAVQQKAQQLSQTTAEANATEVAMRRTIAQSLEAQGATAEEAAQAYKQLGIAGAQAAAEISAAFPEAAAAVEETTAATGAAAGGIGRMEGAMAYGTVRAAAFAGQMGPLGYVLGTVGRASEALAPMLQALFPLAMIGVAIDLIQQWAEKWEQASEKLDEAKIKTMNLSLGITDLAQSTELENLKLQDQIDKLEGVPTPNALDESILQTTIDTEHLLTKMADLGVQANKTLEQTEPGVLHAAASSLYRGVAAAALFGGGYPLEKAHEFQYALENQHRGIEEIKKSIMGVSLSAQEMAEKLSTSGLKGKAAFEAQQSALKSLGGTFSGLSEKVNYLGHEYGLNEKQMFAVRQAVIAYEEASKDMIEEAVKGQDELKLANLRAAKAVRAHADAFSALDERLKDSTAAIHAETAAMLAGELPARERIVAAAQRQIDSTEQERTKARQLLHEKRIGAKEEAELEADIDAKVLALKAERDEKLAELDKAAQAKHEAWIEKGYTDTMKTLDRLDTEAAARQAKAAAGGAKIDEKHPGGIVGEMPKRPDMTSLANQQSIDFASHIDMETRAVTNFQNALMGLGPVLGDFAQKHQIVSKMSDQFSEAMGKNIAMAIVYGDSIGKAAKKAAEATIASLAAQSLVYAIEATAYGFWLLAHYDFAEAANAFEAAALFGAVGGAAAVAAHALGGGAGRGTRAHSRSGSEYGGGSRSSGEEQGNGPSAALAPGSQRPVMPSGGLTIAIMGNEEAGSWLANTLNKAVTQNGVQLTASHAQRSAPVGQ